MVPQVMAEIVYDMYNIENKQFIYIHLLRSLYCIKL